MSGGQNEFVVRGQGESDPFTGTFDEESVSGVVNKNESVVFLTGVQNSSNSAANYWANTFHAYLVDSERSGLNGRPRE